MKLVGDDEAGFSVAFDAEAAIVHVRAWGFWSADVATAFEKTVGAACMSRPKGTELVMDMTDLKPMREEGQRSFGALVSALPTLRIARASVATGSHLTKLQLLRLVGERGQKDTVQFIQAAAGVPKTV